MPRVTRPCHGTKRKRSSNRHFGPPKTRVRMKTASRVLRWWIWAKPDDKRFGRAIRAASRKRLLSTAVRTGPEELVPECGRLQIARFAYCQMRSAAPHPSNADDAHLHPSFPGFSDAMKRNAENLRPAALCTQVPVDLARCRRLPHTQ